MNENVKQLLEKSLWDIATMGDEPNVVPVAFKAVSEDGKLLVGDVFMDTTVKNVTANGKVAVSVYSQSPMRGYQIKGKAEYVTEGPVVAEFKKAVEGMFKGAMTAKGALIITPENIIVTSPGPENKKEI